MLLLEGLRGRGLQEAHCRNESKTRARRAAGYCVTWVADSYDLGPAVREEANLGGQHMIGVAVRVLVCVGSSAKFHSWSFSDTSPGKMLGSFPYPSQQLSFSQFLG